MCSQRGIRKKEPIEVPKEIPTTVETMINLFLTELSYTKEDLAKTFTLHLKEFEEKFFGSTPLMRVI